MNELAGWLIDTEMKYGGLHRGVLRRRVSPFDPRTPRELMKGGMTGGDRMFHHNYAPVYSQYLPAPDTGLTVVELGILRGVGLAVWCDLFSKARVIGLDVDLSHYEDNKPDLLARGAFANNQPEVYQYDELAENNAIALRTILGGTSIDVCIDDALHYEAAILKAMQDLMPFMRDGGVYFVEDNDQVHRVIRKVYPKLKINNHGRMTVLR